MAVEAEASKFPVGYPESVTRERRFQDFRATVDQNETITLDIGTIVSSGVYQLSDGAVVAHTPALGVITINAAGNDVDVVGFAIGEVPA